MDFLRKDDTTFLEVMNWNATVRKHIYWKYTPAAQRSIYDQSSSSLPSALSSVFKGQNDSSFKIFRRKICHCHLNQILGPFFQSRKMQFTFSEMQEIV